MCSRQHSSGMRLPRRVPWASIGELDQVCSWIYADENDRESRLRAVQRLSAWRAITALPHALESTLSILTVILQDDGTTRAPAYLSLRQSYASAIVRLVNGLVDPLQFGVYARSIASIAAQLGLPAWLVELRHAATHEDLPSLELLRDAASEAMGWLLHNYFLPTLNPSSSLLPQQNSLRPIHPLLKKYKTLLKITTKDASLKNQYKLEISSVLREIERWISEAKVAASAALDEPVWNTTVMDDRDRPGEEEAREGWALEQLCQALVAKGGLVPVSQKKRVLPKDTFHPTKASVALWEPLLRSLQSNHPDFPAAFVNCTVSSLVSKSSESENADSVDFDAVKNNASFSMYLARWAAWIFDVFIAALGECKRDTGIHSIVNLVQAVGPLNIRADKSREPAVALTWHLCRAHSDCQEALETLLAEDWAVKPVEWTPDHITKMDERLRYLLSLEKPPSGEFKGTGGQQSVASPGKANEPSVAPGWVLLSEADGWRPSPIGVHVSAKRQL